MSNAAIIGKQIGYAPGWRAEVARIGIDGWSKRLMEMRFLPGTVRPDIVAWLAQVQAKALEHVVVGLGELLIGTDLTAELDAFNLPLLMMMPDRSPFVSLGGSRVDRWRTICARAPPWYNCPYPLYVERNTHHRHERHRQEA